MLTKLCYVFDFIPLAVVEIKKENEQDSEDFWRCGVHGKNWRGDTHILYKLSTSPTTAPRCGIVTNAGRGGKHAEIKLIDKLKKRIARMDRDQRNNIILNMYMNRSPCGDCAESLIGFKNRRGYDITITIKAAQPYKCKRITCSKCYWDWSGKHNRGLIGLNRNGISVNAWDWSNWQFLADYLNGLSCSKNCSVPFNYDIIFCDTANEYNHYKSESRSKADSEAQEDFDEFQ